MKLEIKRKGKNRLSLRTEDPHLDKYLRARFSVVNKKAKFSQYASPRVSPITPLGSFKAGILQEILDYMKEFYPQAEIIMDENVQSIVQPVSFTPDKLEDLPNPDFEDREYQEHAVRLALENGRGTFEMATSAGKSYIITKTIHNLWIQLKEKRRVLVLVPNLQLVAQFYKDMLEYGLDESELCMFSGMNTKTKKKPETNIIISNMQWLNKHANELPKDIGITIIDEAHMLKRDNKVCKLVESLPLIRFAFTGTLPEDPMDKWNAIGIAGQLLKVTKAKKLQEAGFIANIDIVAVQIDHNVPQPRKTVNEVLADHPEFKGNQEKIALDIAKARFPLEWRYIEGSEKSNKFICKLALKQKGNTIILFDHTEHGELLRDTLKLMTNIPVHFINGNVKIEDREDIRVEMEEGNGCILVANTKAFGTGTNIKAINNIIFGFSSGNSTAKIIQGIGRGLRMKAGKTKMTLFDIFHSFRYSMAHFEKRKQMYQDNYSINSFKKVLISFYVL